ncbi:lipopolysaccharide-binding protein-like isoform X1 [Mercenaria mercenaria]|uniref:lipopolysaccharide-binding protein-like isoform X1 n=1 Tax=Mercenaria mercenaria TaxID=6596 RepID=UPI00234F368A|nr:lipopolysaccharide-binding protein-like isoform X1 [Mercenaria mercenaria]
MSFMRYMYSLVVVVYILAHIGYLEATAGMRITVAETTLKMVNEAEINELQRDLNGKRFDGLRDSEGSWRLSNIHVQYLGTMTSGINLLSNGQIRWTCDISSITVEADWWGRLSGLLSFISAGGSLEAKARRTSLSISLTLTENSGGLGISLSICSASVGSFNLNFSDNLFSWLFNIISSVFQHDIKRTLEDSICDFVRKGMNNITADMRNINTSFPIEIIGIPLTLNNSFTQVTVNSNTISTYHKASLRWNGLAFYSADTTVLPATRPSHGIAFDLREDVVNNLLRVYAESGHLDGSFNYSRVVQKGLDEFRLTCKEGPPGICFGSIIRQVAEEYPDRVLGMQWKVHSANLNIQNGQIKAELTGRVNCSADSANESLPLFSAQVELVVAYELKFSAGELSARSVAWGGHANIDRSNIGKILIPSVQAATNVFILPALQKDILDMINECNSSYKFELPKNVFIKESGLSLYEGVVRVEADLCYKTTSCRSAPNNEWVGNKDIPKFTVDDIIPTHNDDDNNNNDTAIINNSIFV